MIPAVTRSAARARHVRGNQPIARRRTEAATRSSTARPTRRAKQDVGRGTLRAKESQDRRDRRLADVAIAQAVGREPVFVVLEPLRQTIGDRAVKAGGQETSDSAPLS